MTPEPGVLRAVLDANVLVPASLRDTLLRAAEEGLFVPFWSDSVLSEVHRTLVNNRTASVESATRLIVAIQRTFPDATTTTERSLTDQLTNDPKDRHVLAAAIATEAALIVTFNVRHFGERDLSQHLVSAWTPDMLLQRLLRDHRDDVVALLVKQAGELKRRPTTVEDVLRRLDQHAPTFVRAIQRDITNGG